MSLFANLARTNEVQKEKDVLPTGFQPIETGVYDCVVKLAYTGVSSGGAQFVQLELKTDSNFVMKQTLYITSGTKKGGKHFYEKNGKKFYQPGFVIMDELAALASGIALADQSTETKDIKVWDYDTKGEVIKEVPVLTDLVGKSVKVGIKRVIENKRAQNDAGNWVDTAETKTINEIDKVFDTDGFTYNERIEGKETPEFINKWKERFDGKDHDKSKKVESKGMGVGVPSLGGASGIGKPGIPSLT